MMRGWWWDRLLMVVAFSSVLWMAPASAQGSTAHDVRVLKRQVRVLTRTVNVLAGEVQQLRAFDACFGFVPVDQFGDPAGSYGYSFAAIDGSTGLPGAAFFTSALDVTDPVVDPAFIPLIGASQSCVSTGRRRVAPRLSAIPMLKAPALRPSRVR